MMRTTMTERELDTFANDMATKIVGAWMREAVPKRVRLWLKETRDRLA